MSERLLTRSVIVAIVVGLVGGCTTPPDTAQPAYSRPAVDVVPVAKDISDGLGAVNKTNSIGDKGPVIVFEEYHTSRIGQLQIAAMLVRLHDKYAMKAIGLEGKAQSPEAINATWYRRAGGDAAKDEREDVAVRLVAEGEVSSAEFIAMQYSDVNVYDTEDAALYAQTLDVQGNPEVDYLLAIAEKA